MPHISDVSVKGAAKMQELIWKFETVEKVDVFHTAKHIGCWRLMIFWESKRTKEIMITLCVTENSLTESQMLKLERELLSSFPINSTIDELKIVSLSLLLSNSVSGGYNYDD